MEDQIKKIEALIRTGEIESARKSLLKCMRSTASFRHKLSLAKFTHRLGMPLEGIRILRPIVEKAQLGSVCIPELIDYSFCLLKLGATSEALKYSQSVSELPEAELLKACAYMSVWDYESAYPCLLDFLSKSHDPYRNIVAKLNLVSVNLFTGKGQYVETLLDEIFSVARSEGFHRVLANAHELRAQWHFNQQQYDLAKAALIRAQSELPTSLVSDSLFLRKWLYLISYVEARGQISLEPLKKESRKHRHWETLRECDRYELKFHRNTTLFNKLYFGTPYESYRKIISDEYGEIAVVPLTYATGNQPVVLDLVAGKTPGSKTKIPKLIHRLLLALTKDLYRPQPTYGLGTQLYPEETYDPFATPKKVHEAIRRSRRWLASHSPQIQIITQDCGYELDLSGGSIVLPGYENYLDASMSLISRIEKGWQGKEFSSKEISQKLHIPLRTIQRHLDCYASTEKLRVIGRGRSTRYSLSEQKK